MLSVEKVTSQHRSLEIAPYHKKVANFNCEQAAIRTSLCPSLPSLVGAEVFGGHAVCCAAQSPATIGLGTGTLNRVYPPAPSRHHLSELLQGSGDNLTTVTHDLTPSLSYTQNHGPNTAMTWFNTESHMDPPSHHWAQHSHSLTQHSQHWA